VKVLVVDDDPQIVRALRVNLEARGHAVAVAETAADALVAASAQPPDVVLLDLGLPDRDGIDVIHGIRGWSDVPILVLSGRSGGPDKVAPLDAGADDYITKPFGIEELLARVRAVTRRAVAGEVPQSRVALGDVVVDLARRSVTREGAGGIREDIHLTPTEWHLLEVLARNPGRLLSQRYLLAQVWGEAYVDQPANLRLYVTQLRRKLEPVPTRPRYFLTEPGMGYRFAPPGG
jgi:two-component system KDP operon response regulator KdpE